MKPLIITICVLLLASLCYANFNDNYNITVKPCPICNSTKFLHKEFRNDVWTIVCMNPLHFPFFLVMASSEKEDDLIKVWNERGLRDSNKKEK